MRYDGKVNVRRLPTERTFRIVQEQFVYERAIEDGGQWFRLQGGRRSKVTPELAAAMDVIVTGYHKMWEALNG